MIQRRRSKIAGWGVYATGPINKNKRIVTYDGDLDMAFAPMSVTLTLDDEIDISRGDVIAVGNLHVAQRFSAELVWMDERPLDPSRQYLLKHTTRTLRATVDRAIGLNEIGSVTVSAARVWDHM